jgi:hypothetical protein
MALAALAVGDGRLAAAQAPAAAGRGDASAVLAAARQALGGEKKLSGIKTLTASGRTRQVRGDNLVPIEFELFLELPDKYVRQDEIPAQETGVTVAGFNGADLVQDPPPPPMPALPPAAPGGAPMPPRPDPSAARVLTLKQDFARLALGLFATSFSSYPLTFTYVAEAQAPEGTADVIEGTGANGFTVRLFVSRDTHLPLMVSWVGAGGGRGMRGAPPARGPAPENRLYFADYRDVSGVQLPFRVRRAVGADTVEETTFDRFKVNAKIDPRRFEVRR